MNEEILPQPEEPASVALRCSASPPNRILVVEDDSDIRNLNTEVLIFHGYQVDAAEDGAVAWNTLQSGSYDLLVTDDEMPNVSGIELLKKLHAVRKGLPVIMAASKLPREEFNLHPWIRPTALLLKPYTTEEFLGTVQEVLRAVVVAREQIAPPSDWENLPAADGWQL